MTAAIVIALIALAGSVFSTVATVFWRPALDARGDARKVLDKYRDPLVAAAYELQARIYNILHLRFVEKHIVDNEAGKRDAAIQSTLYVFAQYFGWREIIRHEVQYLRFSSDTQTREVGDMLHEIAEIFLSDAHGHEFMIWRVEQRGLGERMIDTSRESATCLGYATFIEQRAKMAQWLDPLEQHLVGLTDAGRERLTMLQNLLLDLVLKLDPDHTRYPSGLKKA
jgi:hypothetical protein